MAGRKIGSSELIEFTVSLLVGLLAVLGGLFVIAFLLVEPVRHGPPDSEGVQIPEEVGGCAMSIRNRVLPHGCTHNGAQEIQTAACSQAACERCSDTENDGSVCCCRVAETAPIDGIECLEGIPPPLVYNTTRCSCSVCDDIPITVTMTVLDRVTLDRIRAAQVYRVDSGNQLQPLGITDNQGRYMFIETAATRNITILIMAADYLDYRSQPLPLVPSRTTVVLELRLISVMTIPLGLGGSAITLRLGPNAVIYAPPGSFHTADGTTYEELVTFQGMVMSSDDENGFDGIPSGQFTISDPETGNVLPFGALLFTFIEFMSPEGDLLIPDQLSLTLSVPNSDGVVPDIFLAIYNESSGQWQKFSNFTQLPQFERNKRQDPAPLVLEALNIPSAVFMTVAQGVAANCWLQGRVFDGTDVNNPPIDGPVISLETEITSGGSVLLFRFGTQTGSLVNVNDFEFNSLCLPVHCDGIISASLTAREGIDGSSMRLLPLEFPDDTFAISDPAPVIIGTLFLFDQVVITSPGSPKPFYSDFATCSSNALEPAGVADPSDFFSFSVQNNIPVPTPIADTCFIKVQIRDCFDGNSVTVTSIDPDTGGITRTETIFVTDPIVTTTEFTTEPMTTGSGTLPPETTMETTTEQPFVCDDTTAVTRTACLPFVCDHTIQLIVRPNDQRGLSGLCNVTNQAILIPFISIPPVEGSPFVIRTNLLITQDYNQEILGIFHEEGNTAMQAMIAEEMCNFGGMSTASTIDPDMGVAVEFSCLG